MEKTKKTTKKKITPEENKPSEEELNRIKGMRIFGYEDSMQVARSIMGSIHENLLHGDLIFAYRSTATSNKSPLFQVVVVNDLKYGNDGRTYPTKLFSVSLITAGYSAYIPHMPVDYLDEVVGDLEEGKADKKIIENFKIIVENLKTKIKEGKV
jgi:hypothetical protein